MKKGNFKERLLDWAWAVLLVFAIVAGAVNCNLALKQQNRQATINQNIAEFACNHDYGDRYDNMTVKVIGVDENERFGGEEIRCIIYDDGKPVKTVGFNKSWYQGLME